MSNPISFVRNQIDMNNSDCIIYGVKASDVLLMINESNEVNEWSDEYYLGVSMALKNINNTIKKLSNY